MAEQKKRFSPTPTASDPEPEQIPVEPEQIPVEPEQVPEMRGEELHDLRTLGDALDNLARTVRDVVARLNAVCDSVYGPNVRPPVETEDESGGGENR